MLRRNKTDMEKDNYIWKKENIFFQKTKQGKKKYIWRRNICFFAGEKIDSRGKGGKYLEKENMFFCGGEESEKEKEDHLREAAPSR